MSLEPLVSRRLRLRAQPDRLDAVHGALEHFWSAAEDREAAPGPEARMQFDLAVVEVAANICEHARPAGDVVLELDLALYADRVEATFRDNGRQAALPSSRGMPSDQAESGRGLAIIERAVDEVRYERSANDVNVWYLRKRISPALPATP